MVLLLAIAVFAGFLGSRLPGGFLPEEDQGYFYLNVQLPTAASLERTDDVAKKIEAILKETPGVEMYNTIAGFSLLSVANTSYNAFYFVTLKPWDERTPEGLTSDVIMRRLNGRLAGLAEAQAFAFAPPAIPGIGTSGGATFMLEDRSGQGVEFLAQNTDRFLQAARQRPEFALLTTTFIPTVPQVFADVDRDKVLKQGVDVNSVYQTLQAFMGGLFVNYFNRFGRVWQVYVQAEGEFRTASRERRVVPRAQQGWRNSAALHVGHDENHFGPRIHEPLQRLPGGADQRHPGARVQFRPGPAGLGRGVCPNHAAGNGL